MFTIRKRIELSGAHCLNLPYDSKCTNLHGHNWIVVVEIVGETLNEEGMLIDFTAVKRIVMQFDHANINELLPIGMNPTAENMAYHLTGLINDKLRVDWTGNGLAPQVSKIEIQESEGNTACYIP